jgi:hypothetical protein
MRLGGSHGVSLLDVSREEKGNLSDEQTVKTRLSPYTSKSGATNCWYAAGEAWLAPGRKRGKGGKGKEKEGRGTDVGQKRERGASEGGKGKERKERKR